MALNSSLVTGITFTFNPDCLNISLAKSYQLINSPEYDKCDAWANAPEEIGSFRRVKRYNYEMLGVVSPPNAPENILIDFGIIETDEEE